MKVRIRKDFTSKNVKGRNIRVRINNEILYE